MEGWRREPATLQTTTPPLPQNIILIFVLLLFLVPVCTTGRTATKNTAPHLLSTHATCFPTLLNKTRCEIFKYAQVLGKYHPKWWRRLLSSGSHETAAKMAPIVVSRSFSHQPRMGFITEPGHPDAKLQDLQEFWTETRICSAVYCAMTLYLRWRVDGRISITTSPYVLHLPITSSWWMWAAEWKEETKSWVIHVPWMGSSTFLKLNSQKV